MAEIVNLRMARKARKRTEKTGHAAAQRARFGMTKAEKAQREADETRSRRLVDGARLERD